MALFYKLKSYSVLSVSIEYQSEKWFSRSGAANQILLTVKITPVGGFAYPVKRGLQRGERKVYYNL